MTGRHEPPGAGRVIAGSARGTRLVAPGEGTRPLGDRVKESLFAMLEPQVHGAAVLDICAGSGAAGIEALSRGALRAVFVEREAVAVASIRQNLRRAGLDGEAAVVVRAEAVAWLARDAVGRGPFDLAIVDPPYAETDLLERILARLGASDGILAADAVVVAKHFWRQPPGPSFGLLASARERRFGDTALTLYRRTRPDETEGP